VRCPYWVGVGSIGLIRTRVASVVSGLCKFALKQIARRAVERSYNIDIVHIMRTNIVIDDKLMRDTLRATGLRSKREAVELGLRTLLQLKKQAEIRRLRGKLSWQGDLDAMRRDHQ